MSSLVLSSDHVVEHCATCGEEVANADKLVIEKDPIHKACFKCALCDAKLQMGHCAVEHSLRSRYGPRFYCTLVCSTRPVSEKEAKLKEKGVQIRQPKAKK
ncbi:LIM domain-containing protein [Aphelenchoides avenae]|nr:LIM domain-containing protein [Aphelenchus avenae]